MADVEAPQVPRESKGFDNVTGGGKAGGGGRLNPFFFFSNAWCTKVFF